MAKRGQTEFQFTSEILREFLNPIGIEDILDLLKQWGLETGETDLSKLDLFLKMVGTKLSQNQFENLWLLREKIVILRSRSWIVFRIKDKGLNISDSQDLQKKCINYLKKRHLEFNNQIKAFELNDEIYLTLIYHGPFRLYEEDSFQFKVIQPIQRIRCLIDLKDGIIRINGRSVSKIQLILIMLEEIFDTKLKKVAIPAYKISDFVKAESPIKKLTVTCPRTVGGFSGIEKIVIEGPNVVEGLYNLQSRQEIPFSYQGLQKVGPWTEAKSAKARITNRGDIQIKDENQENRLLKLIQD